MRRLTWAEMVEYWRTHETRIQSLDPSDSEGLGNVCRVEAPLWLNRYYARFQKVAYESLLNQLPALPAGPSALDVGCGTGRWCRLLAGRGYRTVGIDLQSELIRRNRSSYPDMQFFTVAIQDFDYPEPFDLVSSVTVLQHIPFDQQRPAIQRMRSLLKAGGHALVLENLEEQAEHVFSRTPAAWRRQFDDAGFRLVAIHRYDYSPALRLGGLIGGILGAAQRVQHTPEGSPVPETRAHSSQKGRRVSRFGQRLALSMDQYIEPVLVQIQAPLPTRHCGFLFQAA